MVGATGQSWPTKEDYKTNHPKPALASSVTGGIVFSVGNGAPQTKNKLLVPNYLRMGKIFLEI